MDMERRIILTLLGIADEPDDETNPGDVPHIEGMEKFTRGYGPRVQPPIGTIGVDLSFPCPCGNETLNLVRGFDTNLSAEEAGAKFAKLWQVAHGEMARHESES